MDHRIEYMPLPELLSADRNPKGHDLEAIKRSIRSFGFINPVIMDENSGQLVVGHGRVQALSEMKDAGEEAPNGIIIVPAEPDSGNFGEWGAPCLRGVGFKDPAAAEAYLVTDNRLTELGGWDEAGLKDVLEDLNTAGLLELTGFTMDDLEDLIAQIGIPELPMESTDATHAETPEEFQRRSDEAEAAGSPNMREVVMLLPGDVHGEFVTRVADIKRRFDLPNNTQAVLYAVDNLWFQIPPEMRTSDTSEGIDAAAQVAPESKEETGEVSK